MKNLVEVFVFNSYGNNEIVDKKELGIENLEESSWERIKIKSRVIKEYCVFDGVVRLKVEEGFDEEGLLYELEEIDEVMWG